MKPNQLANVLIKIVGVYVSLCAIPGVVILMITLMEPGYLYGPHPKPDVAGFQPVLRHLGEAIQMAAGIWLIIRSRRLADHWFKQADGEAAKGTDNI